MFSMLYTAIKSKATTKRDRREPEKTQARGGLDFRRIYSVNCAERGWRGIRSYPPLYPWGVSANDWMLSVMARIIP
jgi:hypothetical protein